MFGAAKLQPESQKLSLRLQANPPESASVLLARCVAFARLDCAFARFESFLRL